MAGTRRIAIVFFKDVRQRAADGIAEYIRQTVKWAPEDVVVDLVGPGRGATSSGEALGGNWRYVSYKNRLSRLLPPTLSAMLNVTLDFRRRVKQYDAVIVHVPGLAFTLFWRQPRCVRKVLTIHSSTPFYVIAYKSRLKAYLLRLLERMGIEVADEVVVVSPIARQQYLERFPKHKRKFRYYPCFYDDSVYLANTVDQSARSALGLPNGQLWLYAGRLDHVKNVDLMIRLVGEARKFQPVCLVIVGDGPDRTRLTRLARELGLEEHVLFRPPAGREQLRRYYSTADALLLFSKYEGFPLVLLEALACGCPAVAVRVGAIPEVLRNGENGLLIEPYEFRDLPSLARRIVQEMALIRRELCVQSVEPYAASRLVPLLYEAVYLSRDAQKGWRTELSHCEELE